MGVVPCMSVMASGIQEELEDHSLSMLVILTQHRTWACMCQDCVKHNQFDQLYNIVHGSVI